MATMNKSDFQDRLNQAREALGIEKFQDIPSTSDFPAGQNLWPLVQLIEEQGRRIRELEHNLAGLIGDGR